MTLEDTCKSQLLPVDATDPDGVSPVYEYPLNGQWIMMDMDDGYILWTGIWKALGNHKGGPLIFSILYFLTLIL